MGSVRERGDVPAGSRQAPERRQEPALEQMSAEWLEGRRDIDVQELVALADYVAPAHRDDAAAGERRRRDGATVLSEWADGDRELLRDAWRAAVLRSRAGEVRNAAAELLWDALHETAPPSPR